MVLLKNDCEKGEGVDLAKKYEVKVYPTFALVDAAGEVTDRWAGYEGVEPFIAQVDAALADRRTIAQKKEAFTAQPTLPLALSLAQYSEAVFASADAVDYYRQAMVLDPAQAADVRPKVMMAMSYGVRSQQFTPADVVAVAQEVLDAPETAAHQRLVVPFVVKEFAPRERYTAMLKSALEQTASAPDEGAVSEMRQELAIDAALFIAQDPAEALRLKRASMDEGWQDDPGQLNSFAWWCFENDVELEAAFDLAMRGVKLAATDGERANVLDTAAEIAYKRGEKQRAIELQEQAVQLMPDRKGFQATLQRFRDGAAAP